MENVYFEDNAGMRPQWLAVRVRLQGGLIPDYEDSFLCRPCSVSPPLSEGDGVELGIDSRINESRTEPRNPVETTLFYQLQNFL